MTLGIIADDVTGATDISSALMRAGCRVIQTFGIPETAPEGCDAIVMATKSRMVSPEEACAIAAECCDFLLAAGADQIFFKYCSTFDSTARGNIGPVIDYLLERLSTDFTIACPSYPVNRRTVYQGHLFVGDRLLSESSLRNHPLTPMTDPDLVRVLGAQTKNRVGLADLATVEADGALPVRFAELAAQGRGTAIVDAITDAHLATIAAVCKGMPLVTGGAALGGALGRARRGSDQPSQPVHFERNGATAMLSGSCSAMTVAQVAAARGAVPSLCLDPERIHGEPELVDQACAWACDMAANGDFLIYSSVDPEAVARSQSVLGVEVAAETIEAAFSRIARALAECGVRKFVVAGGETSGAVTRALGVTMMTFGEEVTAGVPITYSQAPDGYSLVLKSGNFGAEDFFDRARGML